MPPPRRTKKKGVKRNAPATAAPTSPTSSPAIPSGEIREFALSETRAWNSWAEEKMKHMYHPSAEPIIKSSDGALYNDYLDEYSFASRKRGVEAVSHASGGLASMITKVGFEEKYLQPWKGFRVERREELVLAALRIGQERIPESKQEHRLFVPEITLDKIAGGEGEGLLSLLDSLMVVGRGGAEVPIVRNADFERVWGLTSSAGDEESLPISKAVRAYQEEILLIRYSYLQSFATAVLYGIVGRSIPSVASVGSFQSDAKAENLTRHQAGLDQPFEGEYFAEEWCGQCKKRPSKHGVKLLRCSKCDKVGRAELYCSRECQVRHFPSHKKSCGKRLSEAESVPIFSTSTLSQSGTPLSPFLVRQLHAQKLHPQAYWIHFVGEQVAGVTLPTYDQPDVDPVKALQSLTFHHEMLKARERAIYEKDPMSIGLVARSALDIVSAAGGIDEIGLAMSRSHRREAAKLKEAKEERSADFKRQVCTEFEITEAQLDDLMEQAELEGPDWYKTIRRSTIASRQKHERQVDLLNRGRLHDVFQLFDREKMEESMKDLSPEMREGMVQMFKIMTGTMITPELNDPSVSEEEKARLYEDILKAADAWKMDDAGVEEMD